MIEPNRSSLSEQALMGDRRHTLQAYFPFSVIFNKVVGTFILVSKNSRKAEVASESQPASQPAEEQLKY